MELRADKKRTRTISNLTEEQIQQKRRVDRKAQRAFRQRTRDHISSLEQQVSELQLSSGQRENQLLQEIKTLREYNQALVRRLESIASLASTSVGSHHEVSDQQNELDHDNSIHPELRDHEGSQVHQSQSPFPLEPSHEIPLVSAPEDVSIVAAGPVNPNVPEHRGHQQGIETTTSYQVQHPTIHLDSPISVSGSGNEANAHHNYVIEESHPPYATPDTSVGTKDSHMASIGTYRFPEGILNPADSPLLDIQLTRSSDGVPRESSLPAMSTLSNTSTIETRFAAVTKPVSAVLPSHVAPTCPLDGILLGFLNSRRDMISKGESLETVVGPQRASVKALGHTELADSVHPLSRIMAEVMSTYPLVGKPERLGLFYLMHQTMRWQMSPTKETYAFMPAWLRPTVTQITVPHAAWIDNVPWPGVRDILIENSEEYPYRLWTENFTQNVCLNWKFDYSDALSTSDDDVVMHSIFEKHVRRLKNWTVSSEFAHMFPNLMPAIYSPD